MHHQFFLLSLSYVLMVSANAYALSKFQRGATDGYALSYLQPDGQTFSVWGLIYALLLLLVLFSSHILFSNSATAVSASFLLNGLWLLANGFAVVEHLSYWLAVFILISYAGVLALAYGWQAVDYQEGSLKDKITLFAPLSANLAWVVLASLLNLTNTLMDDRLDYTKHENLTRIGGPDWAMGVLGLASLIALCLACTKSDLVYSSVTVWALMGVARHQTAGSGFPHPASPVLKDFASNLGVALAVSSVLGVVARWTFSLWTNRQAAGKAALGGDDDALLYKYVAR